MAPELAGVVVFPVAPLAGVLTLPPEVEVLLPAALLPAVLLPVVPLPAVPPPVGLPAVLSSPVLETGGPVATALIPPATKPLSVS